MLKPCEELDVVVAKKLATVTTGSAARRMRAMWFLSGRLSSEGPVRYIPIDSNPFCVGRSPDASLCLSSKCVSSLHAELLERHSRLILHDSGSTNGTFVNGQRVSEPVTLCSDDLIHFADVPFRVMQQSIQYNAATAHGDVLDQAIVLVLFDKLMNEQAVIPHYQPIIRLGNEDVIGFEALARSNLSQLQTPFAMFSAAAQLGLEVELSQMMRLKSVQETSSFKRPPHIFLNTHPSELANPGLIESIRSLRALTKSQQITLEIHEKAIAECSSMAKLQEQLAELDVDLAFDDFGAGQARLIELVDVHPKYLKFDISLIRGLDTASSERRRLVASLVQMSRDVGAIPLAEGVESEGERDACVELGFELAQGFLFGRPVPLTGTAD
jgi:EAL domain-containing protein (putative c-di-GMP-specific phosphodiesterase class I)